ncbi:MAG: SLC13 family permease [Rhodospirillales bacterium]|nr:MAG: SLC13 family permease [Rhodospirillales bacterium]
MGEFGDATLQMTAVFALIVVALAFYATEKLSFELTSLGVICALLLLFQLAPVPGPDGLNRMGPARILSGFANPALITVLALLVIGDGLARTGALGQGAWLLLRAARGHVAASIGLALVAVLAVSAFLNNIPVVVIFIPIMQALAEKLGHGAGRYMMPLSFAAILGGMTTLIGSSTNLLVSGMLFELGETPFGFFDFSVPGLVLALCGLVYVMFVAPRLLPDREPPLGTLPVSGRQFVAQIKVAEDSKLVGQQSNLGVFPGLPDITLLMVQRDQQTFMPPFEDVTLTADDILVVAATRKTLMETLQNDARLLHPDIPEPVSAEEREDEDRWTSGGQTLAEVMVPPGSPMVGRTLERIGFRYRHHCIVLGIERRSRMLRRRITEIPLEAGDVLLIQGRNDDVLALRGNRDVLLMEWSAAALPELQSAKRASVIFLCVVGAAATGAMPIVVAAVTGAAAMVLSGALSMREAVRALDFQIILTIAAALALGAAMQETGGADFLAGMLLQLLDGAPPAVVLSAFFLLVGVLSNIISTKATAVLFTPIAVGIAHGLEIPAEVFAVAVVFAANCSFASPIGYQTNLLVMVPGHYRFIDFVKAGAPLLALIWIAFTLFAPWYYGL